MTVEVWTTVAHRAPARFDAWRDALNRSHLDWTLAAPAEPAFQARTRQRRLDGVRIVECR